MITIKNNNPSHKPLHGRLIIVFDSIQTVQILDGARGENASNHLNQQLNALQQHKLHGRSLCVLLNV